MPRKGKNQKPEDSPWYYDDDLWLDLIGELDDSQAEHMARLLHLLIKKIQKPNGAFKVRCCLENGRRVIFPFTPFGNECKLLFIESLHQPGPLTLAKIMDRKRSRRH
jgi:hypothetical protein